jgi:hypothetical protein
MARDDTPEAADEAARGRLGQDFAFTIDELTGARLCRLRAVYLRASGSLLLLYLECDRPGVHRLFLDAGVAFWEDWGEVVDDDDDDLDWRDLGGEWGLVDATIDRVRAFTDPADVTRIELDLGPRGRVVLEPLDPSEFDGPNQVRLVRG